MTGRLAALRDRLVGAYWRWKWRRAGWTELGYTRDPDDHPPA